MDGAACRAQGGFQAGDRGGATAQTDPGSRHPAPMLHRYRRASPNRVHLGVLPYGPARSFSLPTTSRAMVACSSKYVPSGPPVLSGTFPVGWARPCDVTRQAIRRETSREAARLHRSLWVYGNWGSTNWPQSSKLNVVSALKLENVHTARECPLI